MDGISSYSLDSLRGQVSTVVVDECEDSFRLPPWAVLLWMLVGFTWMLLELVRQLQQTIVDLRCQANYWRTQHERAKKREAKKATQIDLLEGQIRELKRQRFGRKSETKSAAQAVADRVPGPPRPRGQQRGSKGHGRRRHDHLPAQHEDCTLPDPCCPDCGQTYQEIPGTADGEILEIEVRAHRRCYHRRRYRRHCKCTKQPAVIAAPPPDKLLRKGTIGISVWVLLLLRKFAFFQPLHRILAELRGHGLHLSAGTITDGLQKLVPLFEPLYQLLVEHNRGASHWHGDETRWFVFVRQPDKANFTWMLWVFATQESIAFVLDPTRSHDVPETHFGDEAQGIMNVDRYSAYKAMPQVKEGKITLAFCWAHVRRDFLAVLTGWSELSDWAWWWLDAIGTLYHHNDQRLAVRDEPIAFAEADQQLRQHVEDMRRRCDTELSQPLRQPQRKVLDSLKEHWTGLTVFVDRPEVPMDNNEAERRQRGPVIARKNFYGSGALWSGRLAAMLFSLFQTVQLWSLDVNAWLTAYLTDCAKAGGQPPPDLKNHLPWNMTAARRDNLRAAVAPCAAPTSSNSA